MGWQDHSFGWVGGGISVYNAMQCCSWEGFGTQLVLNARRVDVVLFIEQAEQVPRQLRVPVQASHRKS